MKRELVCIVCPLGCKIEVGFKDENSKEIEYINGNTCKRGEKYATEECTCPTRMVTSTVLCGNGDVVPVKLDRNIPKEKIFECMSQINNCKIPLPISSGDVIIKNVAGTDANVIVTVNKSK